MKLVLNIEDTRVSFFLELLSSLNFVTIEADTHELSEEEEAFIDARLLHHAQNKDKSVLWTDLKKQIEQTA
jgi:hypothetical protein